MTLKAKTLAVAVCSLGINLGAQAYDFDLSGIGYVQYGDGQSYSLPIANLQTNSSDYTVMSGPGQIMDLIVLATGANGQNVTTNSPGMDDAYDTPSGNNSSSYFSYNTGTYRGTNGTVANNGDNTWDASVASLLDFVGSDTMTFFFNNNQENSGGQADQSLAAWARLWVTDPNGDLVGSAFEFTNNSTADVGNAYDLVPNGGGLFQGDVTNFTANNATTGPGDPDHTSGPDDTDFVLSGGSVCVLTGTGITVPIPVDCGTTPGAGQTLSEIDHNLGANDAGYAVIFPELNELLSDLAASGADLTNYTFHMDLRLGCMNPEEDTGGVWMDCETYNGWGSGLNSGYEQLFIGTTAGRDECPDCGNVPEPQTLGLIGLGLVGLWMHQRRRRLDVVHIA